MRLLCAEQIDKEHAYSPELSSQSWLCYLSSVFPLTVLSWLIIYNYIKYLTYPLKYIPISLVLNEWRIAVRFPESFLNRSFLGISKNMGDAYSFCSLSLNSKSMWIQQGNILPFLLGVLLIFHAPNTELFYCLRKEALHWK